MTTRGEINSNFYQIVNVDGNGAPTSVKPQYLPNVGNANYAINAGHANIADSANSVAGANVTGTVSLATHANIADLANSVAGSNVTGVVGNATHANIADLANSVAGSNVTGVVGNATHANIADLANSVAGSNVTGVVGNATHATISDSANLVAVANVSGIGNIATINLSGNGSQVLLGNGTWGAGGGGGNTANANYANFAGTAFNVSVGNVSGIGNIAVVNLDGNSSNILFGNGVFSSVPNTANANYANFAGNAFSVAGANVTGFVANANVANTSLGSNVIVQSPSVLGTRYVSFVSANTGGNLAVTTDVNFKYNGINGGTLTTGVFSGSGGSLSLLNASNLANGTVPSARVSGAYTGITSVGTLTDLSVTGNVTSGHFIGNASNVTGLSLTDSNFIDVLVTSPVDQQVLQYNGSIWVNNTLNIPTSAGSGVNFWFTTPILLPTGSNNEIQLDTLNNMPNVSAVQFANVNINNTSKVIIGTVTAPLNRTQFDAGNWSFDISAYANTAGAGTRTIQPAVYQVNPGSGTVTITGTGTTRTVTASLDSPFANSTGSANLLLCSYLQTTTGLFQINAKTSSTVVTIDVPTTYVNQSAVSYFVYDKFFSLNPVGVSATPTVYNFSTAAASLPISTTTRLGVLIIGTTNNNKILYVSYNDSTESSHISTPFVTLHDDLAGLQGGQTNEYYHLTQSEYTGTGSGVFVKQTGASLVSPNIDSATGTSLNLTGNLLAGNVTGGNLVAANYISGNGSLLTSITGANVTGVVGNATHANFADAANNVSGSNVTGQVANALIAGTVYTNAQPNITSVGTLSSLTVTGNLSTGNASLGNLAVANFFQGDGHLLTNVSFSGNVANANYANFAGQVVDATQSNITTVGTLLDLNVEGNIFTNTAIYVGNTSNATGLTNPTIVAKASGATYVQGALINGSANGSADWVSYGDNGSDSGAWADMGFTGSGFNDPLYTLTGINDGYFIVQGDDSSAHGGNLVIATGAQGSTKDIVFGTGGFLTTDEKMRFIHAESQFYIEPTTVATDTTTGALRVGGGVGIAGDVYAGNVVSANYFVGDGSLLTGITATTANYANFAGEAFFVSGGNVSGEVANAAFAEYSNIANTANTADTAFAVAGANVSGQVSFAAVANSVAVANVSGIGNIAVVNLDGNLSNILYGNGVFAAAPSVSNVANANYANFAGTAFSVAGANVTGIVSLATHANVADLANSVAGANVTGTVANANYANFAGTAFSVAGANVTGIVGNATHANFADVANSVAGINVTGTVANATYAISAGSATVAATVTTNAQPNITSTGTLTSLSVTGNITAGNVAGGNLVSASYVSGNGSLLTSLTGANVTGTVANATYALSTNTSNTAITVTGGAQPNIVSVGTLTNLTVSGYGIFNNRIETPVFNLDGFSNTRFTGNIIPTSSSVGTIGNSTVNWSGGYFANLSVTGNVSANYYIGNGSALTGITATATPGGANTQVQFNNNGSMGGISTVTWNGSNISLGSVTSVKITGGSSGQVISTDGTGNLSFVAQTGGGGSSGFENIFLMMGA